jgi:hypothetical protein
MLPAVLKIALVAFIVIGLAILVITFIRRSRARGFPTPESSSYFWQAKGAMPPTPKPPWTEEERGEEDGEPRRI